MSINSILEKRNKFQQTVETTSNFDFEFYGIEDDFTRSELLKKEETAKRNIELYNKRTILFLDEIHRFNKNQQDALLSIQKMEHLHL